ncbi:hypothetical protein LIER_38263 [Lithospermum erythrorhizon]|uniref:Uncharacterized protein n=1 Tax=Lithospermum erythrorhizon TaxID=34254 RepID=A0AAV3Q2E0_LITER
MEGDYLENTGLRGLELGLGVDEPEMGARLRCATDERGLRGSSYEKAMTLRKRFRVEALGISADLLRDCSRRQSFLLLISGSQQ